MSEKANAEVLGFVDFAANQYAQGTQSNATQVDGHERLNRIKSFDSTSNLRPYVLGCYGSGMGNLKVYQYGTPHPYIISSELIR